MTTRIWTKPVLAMGLAAVCLGPVLMSEAAYAGCSDEIATMEKQIDAKGRAAGAATSSGQAVSAQRSEKAIEASKTDTPVAKLPTPPTPDNVAATQQAANAGAAGDGVMQAKVSLNDANNAMKKGDETACLAAVAKAKAQIAK